MNTFLLIESGATKLDWILANEVQVFARGEQLGLHPQLVDRMQWRRQLLALQESLPFYPDSIYYYGTGCSSNEGCLYVVNYFQDFWQTSFILEVETDLLAAARALCQEKAGLVCILGTGSNTAAYANGHLLEQRGGLGFILGDEGSGAALGKALLKAFLEERLPAEQQRFLQQEKQLSRGSIIDALYKGDAPSRYLAKWAPLLYEWLAIPAIQNLIQQEFKQLVETTLLPLADTYRNRNIHFAGSIAFHFRAQLVAVLAYYDLQVGSVLHAPMQRLLHYHQLQVRVMK
ncbi:MAG: hypothetical protein AAF798_00480 [Bacteroidota bacterium]